MIDIPNIKLNFMEIQQSFSLSPFSLSIQVVIIQIPKYRIELTWLVLKSVPNSFDKISKYQLRCSKNLETAENLLIFSKNTCSCAVIVQIKLYLNIQRNDKTTKFIRPFNCIIFVENRC